MTASERVSWNVRTLPHHGTTVLFVEHDMDVVHDVSDWVVVMAEGRVIAEGPPDAVGTDPRVIDAYLGAHHDAPADAADERAQLEEAEAEIRAEVAGRARVGDDS